MANIRKLRAGRVANEDPDTWVGQLGTIFYREDTGRLRLADGVTPGGVPLQISAEDVNLAFGDFLAEDNTLSLVNNDQDMILATKGNAEIQLVGNIGFYQTNVPPPLGKFFEATKDGQISIYVPNTDPTASAVKIIGSLSGNVSPPINTGVMLHLTGNNNDPSRLYNDGIGSFAAFVGRRINGTVSAPTAVLANDEIIRISSTGHNGTTVPGSGSARIVYQAIENYTPTATGSNISLWTCAIGSNTLSKIATIDVANGVSATKFTGPLNGNVTATTITASSATINGNLTTTGNIIASGINATLLNGTSNIAVVSNGNVSISSNSTANVLTVGSRGIYVTGNISYIDGGDANNVTQLTDKSTAVTSNGRSGRITMSNASLSQATNVTFTVNNTYVRANDVVVVNIQTPVTSNAYLITVSRVANGAFDITLRNTTNGALSDALVLNYAIIHIG